MFCCLLNAFAARHSIALSVPAWLKILGWALSISAAHDVVRGGANGGTLGADDYQVATNPASNAVIHFSSI